MSNDLTAAERSLLTIALRNDGDSGFVPRIDHAHPKHQPVLHQLRARGLLTFDRRHPRIRITDAGRTALSPQTQAGKGVA